jgi:putative flippase GtrA
MAKPERSGSYHAWRRQATLPTSVGRRFRTGSSIDWSTVLTANRPAGRPWKELLKFSVVGGLGFVANLIVYDIAYRVFRFHYLTAGAIAFTVANSNNYLLNRYWTFPRSGNRMPGEYIRFLAVGVAALAGNLVLLMVFIETFELPALAAQALSILVLTPTTFLGNKLWTFRSAGDAVAVKVQSPAEKADGGD